MTSRWAFNTSVILKHSGKSVILRSTVFSASGSHLVGLTQAGELIRWSTDPSNQPQTSEVVLKDINVSLRNISFAVNADASCVALENPRMIPSIRILQRLENDEWKETRTLQLYHIPSCSRSGIRFAAKHSRLERLTVLEGPESQMLKVSDGKRVVRLAFSPVEDKLFAGCEDGSICIYDVQQPNPMPETIQDPHFLHVTCLAVSSRYLAAGYGCGAGIRVWPTDSLVDTATILWKGERFHPRRISFSLCGTFAISTSDDDKWVRVWRCVDGDNVFPIFVFKPPKGAFRHSKDVLAIGFHSTNILIANSRELMLFNRIRPQQRNNPNAVSRWFRLLLNRVEGT